MQLRHSKVYLVKLKIERASPFRQRLIGKPVILLHVNNGKSLPDEHSCMVLSRRKLAPV